VPRGVRLPALLTLEEARELIRDVLMEWLAALTGEERAAAGAEGRRETLVVSVG
jgi:predicted RNase H-like HicB family nuclease